MLDEGGKCELATGQRQPDDHWSRHRPSDPTADGWTDKSQLKPVDLDGKEMQPVPSSYGAPIPLAETATVDEYLSTTFVSSMNSRAKGCSSLRQPLAEGRFSFPYSYRGGLDAAPCCKGEDDNIFFVVGNPTKVEFTGLA